MPAAAIAGTAEMPVSRRLQQAMMVQKPDRREHWMKSKKTEKSKSVYSVIRTLLVMWMKMEISRDTTFILEKESQKIFSEVKMQQNLFMWKLQAV